MASKRKNRNEKRKDQGLEEKAKRLEKQGNDFGAAVFRMLSKERKEQKR